MLTILDESSCHLIILLIHELQVKGSTITDLVINIIQASGEEDADTALNLRVLLANTKLGEGSDSSSSHDGVFKNHSVVNISDILGRLSGLGTLKTDKVKNSDSQLSELAILNELAEVGKRILLGIRDELDQIEHALHNSPLELISTLIAQNTAEEGEHTSLLAGEFEAQGADSLHDCNLELVGNLGHEGGNLLH